MAKTQWSPIPLVKFGKLPDEALVAAKSDREIMRQNAANMEHAYRNLLSEICTGIGDVALELKDLEKSETQAAKAIATLNDMVDKIETALFGKEQ